MLQIKVFTFNPLSENTYLLWDNEQKKVAVIDPGCYTYEEQHELSDFIEDYDLQVTHLLNTHCHVDHVLGNHYIKTTYGVQLGIHRLEDAQLKNVGHYAPMYGFVSYEASTADYFIEKNEEMDLFGHTVKALFCPGHAPGHLVFYVPSQGFAIGGDVLFRQSIGRTDLPGGNHQQLLNSIREELFVLPSDTVIYPGHGPETTIGYEQRYNPYCGR